MKKGFTLIELLVVVLIIGILSAIALPQYEKAVKKSRLAKYLQMVASVAAAEEVFFLANGQYTPSTTDLDIQWPSGPLAGAATDNGYIRYPDGTVVDLLGFSAYVSSGSDMAYVKVTLKDGLAYMQYLHHSAYPDRRTCSGDAQVCKSMGGVLSGSSYILP